MTGSDAKSALRDHARKARVAQPDKDAVSGKILDRVTDLVEYQSAKCVMFYVDAGSEVRTRHRLGAALETGKTIVVPYCIVETNTLELFRLEAASELVEGAYTILEPHAELRASSSKRVTPDLLDLVLVPGLAFDRAGGRMGQGKGYYDRLLNGVRADAKLVALAYACQLVERVPMDSHDVYMDLVVTENEVICGKGRG